MPTVSDSFDYSANALATAAPSDWAAQSGVANQMAASGSGYAYRGGAANASAWSRHLGTFNDDQFSEAVLDFGTFSGSGYAEAAVMIRMPTSGESGYYAMFGSDGNVQLYKVVSGTYTQIGTTGVTATAEDGTFAVTAVGTALTVDWTPVSTGVKSTLITATDSTHTTGQPGIGGFWDEDRWHFLSWQGGDIPASGGDITGNTGTIVVSGVTGTMGSSITGNVGTVAVTGVSGSLTGVGTISGSTGTIAVSGVSGTLYRADIPGNVGTIAVSGVTGTLTAPSPFPYPDSISGRKILDQDGNVYLARTFSSWSLADLSSANITSCLEDVAANGFNGVTVWAGGGMEGAAGGSWDPVYSTKELLAGGAGNEAWWTGTPWASTFGAAWDHMDWIADECKRLGLVLWFSLGGGNGTTGARPDWEAVADSDMETVGATVAARYPLATYPNVRWHFMLDDSHGPGTTAGARIKAYFQGIASVEGTSRPVRWMEPNNGASIESQGWLGDVDALIDMNGLYSYLSNSAEVVEGTYSEAGATTVPFGDVEPPYDGSPHYGGDLGQQLRERTWSVFLEGGSYINYGHEDWWPFGKAGLFSEGIAYTAVQAHSHTVQQSYIFPVIDEFVADPLWAPSSTFADSTVQGSGDTKAAVGLSPTAAIAYFPTSRTVTVDTTKLTQAATVRIRWYDPTAGTYSTVVAEEATNSSRSVSYPSNHGDGTSDYVLVVDAVTLLPSNTFVGSSTPSAIKLGSSAVSKLMMGTTQVWP